MTPSTYIARILGPVLVIIGLGLLLEGETFRAMAGEFLRSAALVYFSGVATLAVGLAILNVHHLWTRDWRSVITVFGWLAVIGGIFRILAPTLVQTVGESFIAHRRWPIMGAIVTLALGAFPRRSWAIRTSGTASGAFITAPARRRARGAASRSAKRPRRKPSAGEGAVAQTINSA